MGEDAGLKVWARSIDGLMWPGACTIKHYGFLFYGKGENLRSAVLKTYFSVNDKDNFSLI